MPLQKPLRRREVRNQVFAKVPAVNPQKRWACKNFRYSGVTTALCSLRGRLGIMQWSDGGRGVNLKCIDAYAICAYAAASSAGPSLGTVQCNCKLYRSVAVISLPGNAWWDVVEIFSRFPLPPLKATGDEAAYAVLEWENDTKFHIFATKHKAVFCFRVDPPSFLGRHMKPKNRNQFPSSEQNDTTSNLWILNCGNEINNGNTFKGNKVAFRSLIPF